MPLIALGDVLELGAVLGITDLTKVDQHALVAVQEFAACCDETVADLVAPDLVGCREQRAGARGDVCDSEGLELAKLQLHGDGVPSDVANGKHWLAILSQSGHAGAQAFLADLYWRGKFMDKDQVRALALISVAVKNAPTSERVWIEDIYQNIYCGASQGVRKQVGGMVAQWDSRYGRPPAADQGAGLDLLSVRPERACANGESVPLDFGISPDRMPIIADNPTHEPATREAATPAVGFVHSDVGSVRGVPSVVRSDRAADAGSESDGGTLLRPDPNAVRNIGASDTAARNR